MNLPNKITITRIVIIFVMLLTIGIIELVHYFVPSFLITSVGNTDINWLYLILAIFFVVASITDFLDGHLARKYNQVTNLGKFLDPIADKILVNSMLILLLIVPGVIASPERQMVLNVFCVIILVARDLVIDGMRLMAAKKNIVVAANMFGKVKTVLQMIAIIFILLNDYPLRLIPNYASLGAFQIGYIVMYLATIASIVSAAIYIYQNRQVFKGND
ncbi:MAG: CDP-diacylglycerol--glycerol-3-phosphate 3-phosphatidyltransferase [Erysipelotrichaceae bacterium]|jgi:CDP-diacylglycerol--glycerol-3-phosphate 3-phosphatidyltransferase|nr:CDP-diacylglycerol--glycerol-3-phosphate 3-phosphatidyltransferase [Erysipelotrichaceae bacterium]